MFGELIGLWTVEVWNAHGPAARVQSRGARTGTRHADGRRFCGPPGSLPDFLDALQAHLVETSPVPAGAATGTRLRAHGHDHWQRPGSKMPGGAGHDRRQRVLRRPAGSPIRGDRSRLVRAACRPRAGTPLRSACAPSRNRPRNAAEPGRRSSKGPGRRYRLRERPVRAPCRAGRRRALHRLRLLGTLPSATPCRRVKNHAFVDAAGRSGGQPT